MAEELNALKTEEPKKSLPQPLSKRLKILTTAAILIGNITFVSSECMGKGAQVNKEFNFNYLDQGCSLNAFSPALDSMRAKFNTTIGDISVVFTITTILYCIGAIACNYVNLIFEDRFKESSVFSETHLSTSLKHSRTSLTKA